MHKIIEADKLGDPSKGCAKRHKKSPTAGTYDGSIKGLTGYKVPGEGNCWVYPRKGKDPEKAILSIKNREGIVNSILNLEEL